MLPDRLLKIEVRLPSAHPQLLEGLDIWLRLGLISDTQVRQICQECLVCSVVLQPQVAKVTADPVKQLPVEMLQVPVVQSRSQKPPAEPAKPNLIATMLQSLGAELSVRWLLFLGVFLVVVSSGVLAASQWERFPASGQYGVLFAYTLSFWGFGFWAAKQNNLRLTAQTLLLVTLLLVPVNFWAMDSFRLWQNPLDWIAVAIATPLLTAITVLLFNNRLFSTNLRTDKLLLLNILGLSFLNWGWKLPGFPLIAVYLAMIGTTIITIYHHRYRRQKTPAASPDESSSRISVGINLPAAIIIYALLLLLVRAIFIANVNITQLGLAIGICGWLMTWLAQREQDAETIRRGDTETSIASSPSSPSSPSSFLIWERLGSILLFLGWLVAVIDYPWQAIAVSGLSLQFMGSRLQRYSLPIDFVAVFVIGLQTIWLGWRLVPASLQQTAIALGTQLTNSQNEPWALLSVALFPYVILTVGLTDWFYVAEKRNLGKTGDFLALMLGTVLTTLALVNPTLRSLNLLLSTITLGVISKRRWEREEERLTASSALLYLTHIMAVVTLCSIIHWLLPNLGEEIWASILLGLMVVEWGLSLSNGIWRRSAWHIGLVLAIASFCLLLINAEAAWGSVNQQYYWGLIWLVTPLTLTGIASRTTAQRRNISTSLSIVAVVVAQILTLQLPATRLISLAVATVVMFANTRYLRYQISAGMTLGFGLSLIAALLWEGIPGLAKLSLAGWFIVGAIATLSLWLGRKALTRQNHELATIYAVASDRWAIALCSLELFLLTVHSLVMYEGFTAPGWLYVTAIAINMVAIIYRSWGQPSNWAFYGIGWCMELLIAELLGFWGRSVVNMAIANIALGLSGQIFGEWWRRRYQTEKFPSSLHILPLMYAALSVLLRLQTFNDWTGLYSLGVSLIVIGIGRRQESFKPLLYFGLIGVSISAYELLFYQMSQAKGGAYGDGLIAMAALGTSIMYAYRILSPWLLNYLGLTRQELKTIAHLHWVWSSFLLLSAISAPIQINRLLGLGTGIVLIQYAIFQGRKVSASTRILGGITIAEMWVYLGLLQIAAIRIYWRETIVGHLLTGSLVPWNGAIACVVAYFLYILPWESWGWSKRPWQWAAYIIPLIILAETRLQVYPITLAIAACFYLFLAKVGNNIRFSYISVALIDWALFRWFSDLRLTDSLWYVTVIGLSLLYIAQIDPLLKLPEFKAGRHSLRMLASGLICGWAIIFNQDTAWIPGLFSLIAIFAGLALRVRAYLYIGTAAFLITSIYQLVIFSLRYPFLKWVVGLLVGIGLISIAANFETRRAQISSLLRNTNDEFHQWQ
jgi:hypothetical protein